MASGVSASGKRNYKASYNSAGNHLVAGRPFLKTISLTQGAGGVDFTSVNAGEFGAGAIPATGGGFQTDYKGYWVQVDFPSTMSQVQVSVQEATGLGIANIDARVMFCKPGQAGASSTYAAPLDNSNFIQLGDTGTSPEGSVSFSTAMNKIFILVGQDASAAAVDATTKITIVIAGHMPLDESDVTPAYEDLTTFAFGSTTGIG